MKEIILDDSKVNSDWIKYVTKDKPEKKNKEIKTKPTKEYYYG